MVEDLGVAKKQTRRCVSISADLYERLVVYKAATGTSMSQVVETSAHRYLDMAELTELAKIAEIAKKAGD